MTFDREPDLDNANVGMPDICSGVLRNVGGCQVGILFFVFKSCYIIDKIKTEINSEKEVNYVRKMS